MSPEPVKISIPASVAAFVRPGTPLQERLRVAGGDVNLPPRDLLLLFFCLGKDSEQEVRDLAASSMASLDPEQIFAALDKGDYHPAVLHTLALSHGATPKISTALLNRPDLADVTREFLQSLPATVSEPEASLGADEADNAELANIDDDELVHDENCAELGPDLEAETGEAEEEYLSKYQLAQEMGIGEKIKMALTGDKEWRKILIKDANKLVSGGVVKNPRMSEPEVLTLLKSGVQNDEIMRLICANKDWVKNYQIRKALIENPKTPLANALRYLGTMNDKDVANYAKSRNISSVVATQAKRLLLSKKR